MIGLDTNVVLRLFDRSDAAQTAAAEAAVAGGGESGCLVNPIVLAEIAWTLRRAYGLDRAAVADHLDRCIEASEFVVPFLAEAATAAKLYRDGPADFADYLLAEINRTLGCDTTITFDTAAARSPGFTLLPS